MSIKRVATGPQPVHTPKSEPAPKSAPSPRASPYVPKAAPLSAALGLLERAATSVEKVIARGVNEVRRIEQHVEHSRVDGKDGFVVLNPNTGRIFDGEPGSARVTSELFHGLLPDGLATVLGMGDPHERVTLRVGKGPLEDAYRTDLRGNDAITLDELNRSPLKGIDPHRGGLLKLRLSAEGKSTNLNVLALPKTYDGPIFVSDIDDTLRSTRMDDLAKGEVQEPIPGAKELLEGVARRGVPIVYLSAGLSSMGPLNDDFLAQMPDGILLSRTRMQLADLSPRNKDQAHAQGDYKAARLAELKAAYPHAKFYGLGDDKYGDAMAYTTAGATAYIHDVRPGDDNLPAGFKGTLTAEYTDAFRAKVLADLDDTIAASTSLK